MPAICFMILLLGCIFSVFILHDAYKKNYVMIFPTIAFFLVASWMIVSANHRMDDFVSTTYPIEETVEPNGAKVQFALVNGSFVKIQTVINQVADPKIHVLEVKAYKSLSYGVDWQLNPGYSLVLKTEKN